MAQGIAEFFHHFFEASAEFERGHHGVKRVTVPRFDDVLQDVQTVRFEACKSRGGAETHEPVGVAHSFKKHRNGAWMANFIERIRGAEPHKPNLVPRQIGKKPGSQAAAVATARPRAAEARTSGCWIACQDYHFIRHSAGSHLTGHAGKQFERRAFRAMKKGKYGFGPVPEAMR